MDVAQRVLAIKALPSVTNEWRFSEHLPLEIAKGFNVVYVEKKLHNEKLSLSTQKACK